MGKSLEHFGGGVVGGGVGVFDISAVPPAMHALRPPTRALTPIQLDTPSITDGRRRLPQRKRSAPHGPGGALPRPPAPSRWRGAVGPACLAASILLFSADNSALAWLLDKAPPYFTSRNILCASNLVALGGFPLLFRHGLTRPRIASVTHKQWLGMLISSILANVIGALLNVEGLAKTRSVALVAILGRLESVWFLVLAMLFLGAAWRVWLVYLAPPAPTPISPLAVLPFFLL